MVIKSVGMTVAFLLLSACGETTPEKPSPTAPPASVPEAETKAETDAAKDPGASSAEDLQPEVTVAKDPVVEEENLPVEETKSPLLDENVIYFSFDSDVVQDSTLDVLTAHALYLADHPEVRVRIEGHCDERGSREYNLGLGENRSKSVSELLLLQGAREDQIENVSFGEESPAMDGHDESAWRLNRRAELVYQ
jgi:peptidoglycan-associated lipoprotein